MIKNSYRIKAIQHIRLIHFILLMLSFTPHLVNADDKSQETQRYEFEMTSIVESFQINDSEILSLQLRWIENPDVTDRFFKLSVKQASVFKPYLPLTKGDFFRIKVSGISEQPESMIFEIIEVINRVKERASGEISFDGFENIKIGQHIDKSKLPYELDGPQLEDCQYAKFANAPQIHAMLISGKIVRIETDNVEFISEQSPFNSLITAKVALDEFLSQHPTIQASLHEYEEGYYLTWHNNDKSKAIVVDYVNSAVTLIKAGLLPYVLYIEGCA